MPFTFAHPAAVVLCTRWRATESLLAAFVIGSMSPDFEYFLRLRMLSYYSHSFKGVFTFCVPVGLVIFLLYRLVVAEPLTGNLPAWFRTRLAGPPGMDRRKPAVLMLAAVSAAIGLGALTHILWDGFTHGHGLFVSGNATLVREIAGIPIYKFLQHGSTLAGFAVIGYWFYRRPVQRLSAAPPPAVSYWVAAALGWAFWLVLLRQWSPAPGPVTWLLLGIDALFLCLVTAGLWARWRSRTAADTRDLAL